MAGSSGERVQIYSDYVCPFCYLGRESLEQYQDSRVEPLEIEWHPFDLRAQKRDASGDIDQSVDDGKDDAYFERAKENVRRLQEQYDVEMTLDIATDIDSLDAQIASYYVQKEYPYETWLEFDRAIFDALWIDGRDIGDRDVLGSLATDAGLDAQIVASVLDDDSIRKEVRGRFNDARQLGITGVPTFVYEDHVARGAVPPAQLERLIEGT